MDIDQRLISYSEKIKSLDPLWKEKTNEFLGRLAIPESSLGDLSDLAVQLVSVSKKTTPSLNSKCLVIAAADHGISAENVSKYPLNTSSLVKTILDGTAAVGILSKENKCDLKVVDMGLKNPLKEFTLNDDYFSKYINKEGTANFLKQPAMSEDECLKAILTGVEIAEGLSHRYDIFGIGDIGSGNTTSAAAVASPILNVPPIELAGVATHQDDAHLAHKSSIIQQALDRHHLSSENNFFEILAKVGGFEIAALTGLILGSASRGKIVVLDGFTSSVAALCAYQLAPQVKDYLIASHQSAETGHKVVLKHLGLRALLRLNMRVGQGVGVPLAFNLIENTISLLKHLSLAEGIRQES